MEITHELKILPEYFIPVRAGLKQFEIRKNDRDYKTGDIVCLSEFYKGEYTGQSVIAKITYITNYEQKDDYVVFGFVIIEHNA